MPDTEAEKYRRAAIIWLVVVGLTIWLAERHFSTLTADLLAWIPFAMFLRCLYLLHKARKARR